MGTKSKRGNVVEVDDRGRITIPKNVREKLGILSGDELKLELEEFKILLDSSREGLITATAGKKNWKGNAFFDAGEALFGDVEE